MNPSYFKIINRFWDEAPDLDGYKTDHSALFFAVVDSINRNGWKDTEIEYDRIINKVRLGKKNYLDGRKWLEANRFITFRPGKGDYAKAKFGLGVAVLGKTAGDTAEPTLPAADAVLPKTAGDTSSDTASGTASDTYLIREPLTFNLLLINSLKRLRVRKKIRWFREQKKRTKRFKRRIPPRAPLPKFGDSFTLKTDVEKLNVPYSTWKEVYLNDGHAGELRKLWMELTDEERTTALDHTPKYMLSAPTRFLKSPANYLIGKEFNNKIIDRNGIPNQRSQAAQPTPPQNGKPFGEWGGNRFGKRNRTE